MASGHVNRTQRPNTWLHRPTLRRDPLANSEPSTHGPWSLGDSREVAKRTSEFSLGGPTRALDTPQHAGGMKGLSCRLGGSLRD
jgi:hypothetical protein